MTTSPYNALSEPSGVFPSARASHLVARLEYPLVATFLLAFLLVGWLAREPTDIGGRDELVYLSLSHSLEGGSFREIFRPGSPLQVQYPPAYPTWLVVVRHAVGENLDLIRLSNLVLVAAALLLLYWGARQLLGKVLALALLFVLCLNAELVHWAGSLMSEGLFLFLATAALVCMLPADAANRRLAGMAIALALAAFLTRTVGLALVLAVGVWLWSRRRRGALLGWGAASALIVGGWFAYTVLARADLSVRSYAGDLGNGIPASGGLFQHLAARVWGHGVAYATSVMPSALSDPSIRGTLVDNWAWLGVNAVLMTVGLAILWRKWRAAAAYVPCYIAVVLLWPFLDGRLLVLLIPFGLLAFLLGAQRLAALLPAGGRNLVLGGLVALLAVGAVQGELQRVNRYRDCDRAHPYVSPGCYDNATLALAAAAQYVREHAARNDVVLTAKPASMNFLSGHLAELPAAFVAEPAGTVPAALRAHNIRFILLTPTTPQLARTLLRSCHDLRVEARFLSETLLLSTSPADQTGSDACEGLSSLAQGAREDRHPNPPE